jgi:hypothetical protein
VRVGAGPLDQAHTAVLAPEQRAADVGAGLAAVRAVGGRDVAQR